LAAKLQIKGVQPVPTMGFNTLTSQSVAIALEHCNTKHIALNSFLPWDKGTKQTCIDQISPRYSTTVTTGMHVILHVTIQLQPKINHKYHNPSDY